MKEDKRLWTEILKWVRLVLMIGLLTGVCVYAGVKHKSAAEPELTSSFISGRLEHVSELASSQLIYTGLVKYSEGSIPFLTQNSFSMIYTAKVRAGIDLSKAQIRVTQDEIVITLPECTVQSIEVDTESIEFYDERLALFNWTEKMDVIDTVAAAERDVSQKADMDSLLESARVQTEGIISGLLADAAGGRKLVIK